MLNLITWRVRTVLVVLLLLARTARLPQGLSRRCFPLRSRRTLLGQRAPSHLHPGSASLL